jgi:hypothetical protein
MPIKSKEQFKLMQAAKKGKKGNLHKIGPSPEVAKKFLLETPKGKKSQFAKAD